MVCQDYLGDYFQVVDLVQQVVVVGYVEYVVDCVVDLG